jgi:hypothetical protein
MHTNDINTIWGTWATLPHKAFVRDVGIIDMHIGDML